MLLGHVPTARVMLELMLTVPVQIMMAGVGLYALTAKKTASKTIAPNVHASSATTNRVFIVHTIGWGKSCHGFR